jgi:hypothetical protein
MPIRGPFGLRRPFASQKLVVDFGEQRVKLYQVGPLGVKRPFTVPNPGVTEEEFKTCLRSRGANSFAEGVAGGPGLADPEAVEEAKQNWCKGILEAIKEEHPDGVFPPVREGEDETAIIIGRSFLEDSDDTSGIEELKE